MNRFCSWSKSRRLLGLLVVAIGLGAVLVVAVSPRTPSAPVIVLSRPTQIPTPLMDHLYRFVPTTPSWAWFWRAHDAITGKRKPVNLFSEIVALGPDRDPSSFLPQGAPTFSDAAGLRVWLLSDADLKALRPRLEAAPGAEVLGRPRISTADECCASLFCGNPVILNGVTNSVGQQIEYYPRVRPNSLDLFAMATLSEVITNATQSNSPPIFIRTNLDLALRLQVPKGSGVFLMDAPSATRRPIALLLDPP